MRISTSELPTQASGKFDSMSATWLDAEISFTEIYRHFREMEVFLGKIAEILLPLIKASAEDEFHIPLNLTIPVVSLHTLTPYLSRFETLEIDVYPPAIGFVFYLPGDTRSTFRLEIGRVNEKERVKVNFRYIFNPDDLEKILDQVQSALKEQMA